MRTYEEISARIMQKGDRIIENRRIRNTKIRQTSFAVSGMCAAVITGVGIWRLNVKDKLPQHDSSSYVIEEKDVTTAKTATASDTKTGSTASHTRTASAVKTTKTTAVTATTSAITSASSPDTTASENESATEKPTSAQQTTTHTERNTMQTVHTTVTSTTPSETVSNSYVVSSEPVTQPHTAQTTQQQTAIEISPVTIQSNPVTPVTIPVKETLTATIPCEAIEETGLVTATTTIETAAEIEKHIIGPLAIQKSHNIIEFGGEQYIYTTEHIKLSELPEGTEIIGEGTVYGSDALTKYFIRYTVYPSEDGKIFIRFGKNNRVDVFIKQ
ncbi:MAG: hypothetical protein WBK46_07975 [Ruminococcus flavefaciens]